MTSLDQKNDLDNDDKMDLQNSDHLILQNNDSNKNSTGQYKNPSNQRKTSKRRQAQQEKAIVLQLFKDLIKVVNQKFQNAYLSPPKNNKAPSKAPKIVKNASVKPNKKEENLKKKQEGFSAAISNHKVEEKSQSREQSQPFPSFAQVNHNVSTSNNVSSPQPFQSFNASPNVAHSVRKSSENASHRQKSQSEKANVVNVLKEALKKEILQNYSMEMKYIIHEEIEEEVQEVKPIQNGKIVQQLSEDASKRVHKNSKNFELSEKLDDLQVLSNENEFMGKFLESMKEIAEGEKELINEESQKCEEEQGQESSSSCEYNQKYPPHSHMPEGHASTTQQFLQQHHPIVATLPHSTQTLLTLHKQNNPQSNLNVQSHKKNQK